MIRTHVLLVVVALAILCVAQKANADGSGSWTRRLEDARALYFADLQGDRAAAQKARAAFAGLARDHPADATIEAYSGSLELLDAARTWAIWDKRKLANEGLSKLDHAVDSAPGNLEARFIRAASTWHLPFFYKRHDQAASDFALIAPHAEAAAKTGTLPSGLAAAALDYYGQVLNDRSDNHGAKQAFEAAVRVDGTSPGGKDALKRLRAD